jgi:hypothetical protein
MGRAGADREVVLEQCSPVKGFWDEHRHNDGLSWSASWNAPRPPARKLDSCRRLTGRRPIAASQPTPEWRLMDWLVLMRKRKAANRPW